MLVSKKNLIKSNADHFGVTPMKKKKIHLVDWDTICKPKESSGLGIVDLHIKNFAFLNKWIWRFGEGIDCLWGKVIVNKNNMDHKSLIPFCLASRNMLVYDDILLA